MPRREEVKRPYIFFEGLIENSHFHEYYLEVMHLFKTLFLLIECSYMRVVYFHWVAYFYCVQFVTLRMYKIHINKSKAFHYCPLFILVLKDFISDICVWFSK